jgi:hypothetical protein
LTIDLDQRFRYGFEPDAPIRLTQLKGRRTSHQANDPQDKQ